VPCLLRDRHPAVEPLIEKRSIAPLAIAVHRAPWYEWALLDGIGEKRAKAIVEWVRAHGPLESLDELEAVPGLPSGWLDLAREHLALDDPEITLPSER